MQLSSEHERYSTAIDHHVHEAQDIEVPLRGIDIGSFGVHINCADMIDRERSDAYPTAKHCYI